MLKKQGIGFLKNIRTDVIYSIDYFGNTALIINGEVKTYDELCENFTLLDGTELWVEE